MKTVKEIMVKMPKYCEKREQLKNLTTRIPKSYSALPVIDEEKKVIGIITEQDIELAVALGNANKNLEDLMVYEVMAPIVYTCNAEDTTASAIEIMRNKKVDCLPVVDKEKKLEGIINIETILNHLMDSNEDADALLSMSQNLENNNHSTTERNSIHYFQQENFEE